MSLLLSVGRFIVVLDECSGYGLDFLLMIFINLGLLTPPLGISCFVIKSTINDPTISLFYTYSNAVPFAATMLLVLILIINFPAISLALV